MTKFLDESGNAGIVGWQTLIINPTDIVETNAIRETKSKWESVQKVARTENSILIYTGSVAAIIIPIRSFTSKEQVDEFFNLAQSYQKGCER